MPPREARGWPAAGGRENGTRDEEEATPCVQGRETERTGEGSRERKEDKETGSRCGAKTPEREQDGGKVLKRDQGKRRGKGKENRTPACKRWIRVEGARVCMCVCTCVCACRWSTDGVWPCESS